MIIPDEIKKELLTAFEAVKSKHGLAITTAALELSRRTCDQATYYPSVDSCTLIDAAADFMKVMAKAAKTFTDKDMAADFGNSLN